MPTFAFRGNESILPAFEDRLQEAGYKRIDDVADADVVLTFCTGMTALEDLYFGDKGLMQTLEAGAICLDISATTPNLASEIAAVAKVSNMAAVFAPLTVRNKVAKDCFKRVNLSCFAGGEADDVKRVRPLLDAIYGDVTEVPNANTAELAHASRTIQNTAEMVAAIETLSLFKACQTSASGFDAMKLMPSATSPEAYFILKAIEEKRFTGGYTVEMLLSDISAAMMTADDYELIMPQTESAFHLFELLAIIGGAEMSPAALEYVYEGDEGDGSKIGLDWSRVRELYGSEHDHNHEDADFDDDYDEADWGPEGGSLGYGYSAN